MKDQIKEAIEYKKLNLSEYNNPSELQDDLEYDGSLHEIIDGSIDIYYHSIRQWAVDNWQYVEEAIEEGLTEGVSDYHAIIQSGQYIYYRNEANEAIEEIFNDYQELEKCPH